jgi:pimeloyl-ACP methyl ester carboxylesterase
MTKTGYIKVRNIEHYYTFLNEDLLLSGKPLLIFLHEGLGSIAQWKDFPTLLCHKTNCPALLFDRYGHGKSEKLKTKRDMNFMHEQAQIFLPELFQNLHLQDHQKILIGHSDGGSIAIIYAGSFSENILGVITIAAHIFLEEISLLGIQEAVKVFEDGKLHDLLFKYHNDKTRSMFYAWAHTWLKPEFRQWNIEEFLGKIKILFLALQGDKDQYGSYAQLEGIKKHVEKAQIELINNCGHIPHLQQKEVVLEIMRNFIMKLV